MYSAALLSSMLIFGTTLVVGDDPALVKRLSSEQYFYIIHDTIVEHQPATMRQIEDKGGVEARVVTGGDIYIDILVGLLVTNDDVSTIAWTKMATAPHSWVGSVPGAEVRRLSVFDVTLFEDQLWILYSENAKVKADVLVLADDEAWSLGTTIELFTQKISEVNPRAVRGATFVSNADHLFVHVRTNAISHNVEVWKFEDGSAMKITRDDDDFETIDRRARVESESAAERAQQCEHGANRIEVTKTSDDTKLREDELAEQHRQELETHIDAWVAANRERLAREATEYERE